MRLISWNVNGLRAVLKKDFSEIFAQFNADVFAIQETKCQDGQVELELPGYHQYFSYAEKKGYSGTAVFCKEEPMQVIDKLGVEHLDTEGRVLALEFEEFWFVDVYTPNSQEKLARIDHRLEWDAAFRDFCKGLEKGIVPNGSGKTASSKTEGAGTKAAKTKSSANKKHVKPVVICGDFNVARFEIDLKNPERNRGSNGFSDEERASIEELVAAGFTDTFRYFFPDATERYSWWSYRFGARQNNAGWRLDYFFVSDSLVDKLTGAYIYDEVMGSDHCPVGLELDF